MFKRLARITKLPYWSLILIGYMQVTGTGYQNINPRPLQNLSIQGPSHMQSRHVQYPDHPEQYSSRSGSVFSAFNIYSYDYIDLSSSSMFLTTGF